MRIVVAYAAGGTTDVTARLIGQWLSERLGQAFLTENRPGGNNNIGTEAVGAQPGASSRPRESPSTLAVIDSGDLAQAYSDDEKARAQLKLTRQALDRMLLLERTSAAAIKGADRPIQPP
jgi:tripartite-type tricarboxylate transporter receptor subunit TctC